MGQSCRAHLGADAQPGLVGASVLRGAVRPGVMTGCKRQKPKHREVVPQLLWGPAQSCGMALAASQFVPQ